MAALICTGNVSLDGYINDENGSIDWTAPSEEYFAYISELERPIGTYLYGRKLYQSMLYWETAQPGPDDPFDMSGYAALWRAADKIVYSTTLATAPSARTRIERTFDPATVAAMKHTAERDLSIGGPTLTAHALRAGLVDELRLFVLPVVIGGGTRFLPDGLHTQLRLADQHNFADGVVYLRYLTS